MKFTGVKIVEASAGAGKTYALSRAYLDLLLADPSENNLKSLLAITFTNKATYEMKGRILELLKKSALDKFENPAVRNKSLQALDTIILNYNSFQVKTIDSFVNLLLSGCAYRLDLPADFHIKRDYEYYLEAALDLIIQQAGSDNHLRQIFDDFLMHYLFGENNKSWSPRRDILDLARDMFTQNTKHGMDFARLDEAETRPADTLITKKKKFIEILGTLRSQLPDGTNKTFLKSLDNFRQNNKDTFSLDKMSDFFQRDDLPLNKGVAVPEKTHQMWQQLRAILADTALLESTRGYDHYLRIYEQIYQAFLTLCRKESILFLPELNGQAVRIFNAEDFSIPELYYRLAARYRYILVDEFQDTSVLQWANLSPLVDEALAGGGGLFLVGDAKQAIYRFRGGAAELFSNVPERLSHYGIKPEKLARNWRSGKEIVNFVNTVFTADNLHNLTNGFLEKQELAFMEEQESSRFLGMYKDVKQETVREYDGYVRVDVVDLPIPAYIGSKQEKGKETIKVLGNNNVEDRECVLQQAVLARIKELLKRFHPGDIAILARTNKQAELATGWLLDAKLPVESEKTLNILEHSSVREVVALLEFLAAPLDNLAFASFILGESFTRISGIRGEEIRAFLFKIGLRVRNREKIYYYREFRESYRQVWDKLIEDIFRKAGFLPLYELIVSIVNRFELLKRLENDPPLERRRAGQGFLVRFLEIVKEKEEESLDIAGFLEYLKTAPEEDLYVQTRESHSIRVMTVHKAKGLEFPAVIVPFTEIEPKVDNFHIEEKDGQLAPLNIAKQYTKFNRTLEEIRRKEYLKSILDEVNTLYVSFTRPKEELHVFVEKDTVITSLLTGLPYEKGQKRKVEEIIKQESPVVLSGSLFEDWTLRLIQEHEYPTEPGRKKRRKEGEILHFLLAGITDTGKQDIAAVLQDRRKNIGEIYFSAAELDTLVKKALAIAQEPKLKQFFETTAEVLTEVDMTAEGGAGRRMDRLLVFPDEVWVVDYKSDQNEKNYEQIKSYCRSVRAIYGKKTRGFLIYMDSLEFEEIND